MIWNNITATLDAWSYPILFLWLLVGVIVLVKGFRQFSQSLYREQRITWYTYPPVLNGLSILSLALAYLLFFVSHNIPFFIARLFVIVMSIIAIFLSALFIIIARRYAHLLPAKPSKRKQTQPKE